VARSVRTAAPEAKRTFMNDAASMSPGRSAMRQRSEFAAKQMSDAAMRAESRGEGLGTVRTVLRAAVSRPVRKKKRTF
jgi:hypothetical protein